MGNVLFNQETVVDPLEEGNKYTILVFHPPPLPVTFSSFT